MKIPLRVPNPPSKPLIIWDGECHFCRRWIERWREITRDAVDYATSQESAERFPEIPREQFERSVIYIETDGSVFFGAEAVFRSLRCRSSKKWMAWSYDHVPGFAAVSESLYRIIAFNRRFASAITRLLWGDNVRPPAYFVARRWFLCALGLIFLIAFVSLWVQIDGLIGSNGIIPVGEFLPAARAQLGDRALSILPTLCWFNSSDAFLHFLCGGGVFLSLLLIVGIAPIISVIGLFVFYLSLTIAGQTFLSFQWDILLLKFLLFKLLLMSGVVKLTSGDDCWWNLTALDYHYWSQPLPAIFAWWADQHPEWFKHFSVAFCLIVEIIVPIFFWTPRRLRLIACGLVVFLQIAIAVTGNYCFFNLLTIALCLLLIDDAVIGGRYPRVKDRRYTSRFSMHGAVAVIVVTLPINVWLIFTAFKPDAPWPRPLAAVYGRLEAFRIVNGYGLFRVMTKDRDEILIEGSADGIDWLPYEFKWKPGDVKRAPGWCAPHQPRLDWQMWFAALGSYRENPWFGGLIIRLLQGSAEVSRLLAHNPFPDQPPRYIRASFYLYRFTTTEEHRRLGAWWKHQELGEYLPAVSLDQLR